MKVHFVGIGGIGQSALAQLYRAQGHSVSGSDEASSPVTVSLQKKGISVKIGHHPSNIPAHCDLMVTTLAALDTNVEVREARHRRIQIMTYPQALGKFTEKFSNICIVGTHGKTTTTAMIAKLLLDAKKDPTIVIGTWMKELKNNNARMGRGKFAVMESCEYKNAFLNYHPKIVCVPTIDYDHADFFKTEKSYRRAFRKFFEKIPKDGTLIVQRDDIGSHDILRGLKCEVIEVDKDSFDLKLSIFGEHNKKNAVLAYMVGRILKIPDFVIRRSLKGFRGSWRRLEYKGKLGRAKLFDDYGHHPIEIRSTLRALREEFPNKKILCVYQPHQYSRTKKFQNEFAKSFADVDTVIVPNIYEARDRGNKAEDEKILKNFLAALQKYHPDVRFGRGLEKTAKLMKQKSKQDDVIITIGAGDIWKLYSWLKPKAATKNGFMRRRS